MASASFTVLAGVNTRNQLCSNVPPSLLTTVCDTVSTQLTECFIRLTSCFLSVFISLKPCYSDHVFGSCSAFQDDSWIVSGKWRKQYLSLYYGARLSCVPRCHIVVSPLWCVCALLCCLTLADTHIHTHTKVLTLLHNFVCTCDHVWVCLRASQCTLLCSAVCYKLCINAESAASPIIVCVAWCNRLKVPRNSCWFQFTLTDQSLKQKCKFTREAWSFPPTICSPSEYKMFWNWWFSKR